jgi:DNA-binding response OmpR family regulator
MSKQLGPATDPPHLLVVCVVEEVLWVLTQLFAIAGYAVTGCPSVARARKLAGSARFALAILDVPADDASVRKLIGFLRTRAARTKILALVSARGVIGQPPLDVDHVAVKPLNPAELRKSVARLIEVPSSPPKASGRRTKA